MPCSVARNVRCLSRPRGETRLQITARGEVLSWCARCSTCSSLRSWHDHCSHPAVTVHMPIPTLKQTRSNPRRPRPPLGECAATACASGHRTGSHRVNHAHPRPRYANAVSILGHIIGLLTIPFGIFSSTRSIIAAKAVAHVLLQHSCRHLLRSLWELDRHEPLVEVAWLNAA